MAEAKKPGSGVFDIAQPGKGQVTSATSRPVMITNRPVMTDPMVNEVPQEEPTTAPPLKATKELVIAPLHKTLSEAPDKTEPADIASSTPETAKPDVPIAEPVVEPVTETKPTPKTETAEPPKTAEEAADKAQEAAKSANEHAARLEKMIEEEKYFLPINAVQQRRSQQIAVIGALVIILLALAWYNVALDAGLLPNTYNLPHTSLFTVQ